MKPLEALDNAAPSTHVNRLVWPGFTLLETLFALALAAILVAWSVPQYQQYALRTQRVQARLALQQLALWMERSATAQGSYPSASNIPAALLVTPQSSYQVKVVSSANSFTLSALPQGAQQRDACATLVLNHLGERLVQDGTLSAVECWSR